MARGKEHPKKPACLARLLAGESPREVAQAEGVELETVRTWRKSLKKSGPDNPIARLDSGHKERVGQLLVEAVETVFESFIARQKFTTNEKWLMRQSAEGLAILDGVSAEKGILIQQARERARMAQSALPAGAEPAEAA